MTADGNATTVNTVGYATMYVANINGDLRPLPTGRALVDKRLHDLISPSAMLKDESGLYQGATLSHNGDFISLTDGDIIPLRFDGKTYYLDYFVSKSATDDSIVRFAEAVYSSPVGPMLDDDADAPLGDSPAADEHLRPLGEMHSDKPSTTTQPLYFRVVDPAPEAQPYRLGALQVWSPKLCAAQCGMPCAGTAYA